MATQTSSARTKKTDNNSASNGDSPVSEKVTETLHHSVDQLGEQVARTEEKLRETASSSAESIKKNQLKAKKMWDDSAVGKYTKEHPVASAGIAFAAGMLLTSLIKRK
ncbi:DUF883 domain-containing protein [Paraglaciecola aquimarina]|uniref:DUF883 domain-containing protein n=1 Tax=Paraglaciecola algarum TaxID=3050085 RepID=A0ABS9D4G6_9ALTE|nr:DUF883 domain-containing protein [Paraglaciecola sp. G1-23]MCF2947847.1 DUF883 domain-containing protein [Paraglaciecola sp. G1-23]